MVSDAESSESEQCPASEGDLRRACIAFIKSLSDSDVFQLCRGGSVWIDRTDALSNKVTTRSFHALGSRHDSRLRLYAKDLKANLLTDFDGISDLFIFNLDQDEDGNRRVPTADEVVYTEATGRSLLLEGLDSSFEADYASLQDQFENVVSLDSD